MKNLIFIFSLSVLTAIISCGEDNIAVTVDPSIQRGIDIALIENYLEDNGHTEVDTTASGVRYVIIEEGEGESIEESDIVTFDFTGKLLTDTIFDTSLKLVVDSVRKVVLEDIIGRTDTLLHDLILTVFQEIEKDVPLNITFSASGWPFSDGFIPGFGDGIISSFNSKNARSVKIGGKVLIAIPSDLAYGETGITYSDGTTYLIKPNEPILFEIYPIKITKQ